MLNVQRFTCLCLVLSSTSRGEEERKRCGARDLHTGIQSDLALPTHAPVSVNSAKVQEDNNASKRKKERLLSHNQGSLPGFPSGRCCCRSKSNFQRGRVGPEEECLFGVHMSNLQQDEEEEQRQEACFSKPHVIPPTSTSEAHCLPTTRCTSHMK